METNNHELKNKKLKIVTIGGGSSYTPELAEGLINRIKDQKLQVAEWWLVDINENDGPKKLEIITNLVKRMFKKEKLDTKIFSTLNRKEALKNGADFVTTQLRVGQLEARMKDERISLEHKFIGQETNGAGGLFKALRTIPVILDIVEDVKKMAPNAWIVNFANPSGIITQAVAKYGNFPKFVGVCNVPINFRIGVANYFKTNYQNIQYDVAGLNHFIYFSKFWVRGKEVTNEVLEAAKNEETFKLFQPQNVQETTFEPNLITHLKALPCGYHRYYYNRGHVLAEYLEHFANHTTRAEEVMALEKELFKKYADPNLDIKPPELANRGGAYYSEVACSVIEAIANDLGIEMVVSTINNNHIVNFPNGLTVEAIARITSKGILPVNNREIKIPENALALVTLMKKFELLTAKAAFEQDSSLALMALQINPLCEDSFEAKKLFNDLVKAHQKYLRGIKMIK